MNLKLSCLIFLLSVFTLATTAQNKIRCVIQGTVADRPYSNMLYLSKENADKRVSSPIEIPIVDGTFSYELYCADEEAYELIFADEYNEGRWRPIVFFSENATIEMQLYPKERNASNVVAGGKLNEIYVQYNKLMEDETQIKKLQEMSEDLGREKRLYTSRVYELLDELNKDGLSEAQGDSLRNIGRGIEEQGDMYSDEGKAIEAKIEEAGKRRPLISLNYIETKPSVVSYYILYDMLRRDDHMRLYSDKLKEYHNKIYLPEFRDHPYTAYCEALFISQAVIVGGKYIDFTAPDFEGNQVTLSKQIAGKVAVIDLWASWCGPCRRLSKSMIPIYEKYKNAGFTIVGIAREEEKQAAIYAADKDKYPWLNLLEINDANRIWAKYGVDRSGGSTYLVDKDGTILAVHPTAEELDSILKEVLK